MGRVTRKVLVWKLSNTVDAGFCAEGADDALRRYGKTDIFKIDRGRQFTAKEFTGRLAAVDDVKITMPSSEW